MKRPAAQPLVVDPSAGKPSLIRSRWRRREPVGDEYDIVTVSGMHDNGADWGGLEACLRPEAGHAPIVTCTAEALATNFIRVDPSDILDAKLAKLEEAGR